MRYYITITAEQNNKISLVKINGSSVNTNASISFLLFDEITSPANKLIKTIDALEDSIVNPTLVQFTYSQASIISKILANHGIHDYSLVQPDKLVEKYQNADKNTQFTANELADHILYLTSDQNGYGYQSVTSLVLSMTMFTVIKELNALPNALETKTIQRFNNIEQFHDTPYGPKIQSITNRFMIYAANPISLYENGVENEFLSQHNDLILKTIRQFTQSSPSISEQTSKYKSEKNQTNEYTIIDDIIRFN